MLFIWSMIQKVVNSPSKFVPRLKNGANPGTLFGKSLTVAESLSFFQLWNVNNWRRENTDLFGKQWTEKKINVRDSKNRPDTQKLTSNHS